METTPNAHTNFKNDLREVMQSLEDMLISKNKAYGDSALNPVRVFSKSSVIEQLNVRIDDKLSRIVRGESAGEDVITDLIGYLVNYKIAMKRLQGEYDPT